MNKEKIITGREKSKPNPVDIHVGARLRMRRSLMGFSQERLADAIGLTFQQIQKYERGTNRVSASRLYQFSKVLDVPISFFYENYSEGGSVLGYNGDGDGEANGFNLDDEIMEKRETLELIRVYYSLPDAALRKDLLKMIKTMAGSMRPAE